MAHDSDLGWALGVLFRAWQRETEDAVGDLPHGPRGFQILAALSDGEPPTQAAIALHLGIDRTVLTYLLDDLEAAGLVERTADARDRRVHRLVLTASGRSRLAELRARVVESEGRLFQGLSSDEAASLRALVERAAEGRHAGDGGGERSVCRVIDDAVGEAPGGVGGVAGDGGVAGAGGAAGVGGVAGAGGVARARGGDGGVAGAVGGAA